MVFSQGYECVLGLEMPLAPARAEISWPHFATLAIDSLGPGVWSDALSETHTLPNEGNEADRSDSPSSRQGCGTPNRTSTLSAASRRTMEMSIRLCNNNEGTGQERVSGKHAGSGLGGLAMPAKTGCDGDLFSCSLRLAQIGGEEVVVGHGRRRPSASRTWISRIQIPG